MRVTDRFWLQIAFVFLTVIASLAIGGARAGSLPTCAGPPIRKSIAVARIDARGALLLRDGEFTRLEGIRLPLGAKDHAPESFKGDALSSLSALVVGRVFVLTGMAPVDDRYGRLRAQAFAGGDWIQAQLLERGLARVSIAPDRVDCASELYAAEARARAMRVGLWSSRAYAVRHPGDLLRDLGTFQIVEGRVLGVSERGGHAWLEFASPEHEHFAAFIGQDDIRTFRAMGVEPRGYAGKLVRVRGIVQDLSGPAISVANPMQVEVID